MAIPSIILLGCCDGKRFSCLAGVGFKVDFFFGESTPLDLFTGFGETEEMVDWSVDVNCSLGHGWGFDGMVELELKLWA